MKHIKDGKLYDVEKSEILHEYIAKDIMGNINFAYAVCKSKNNNLYIFKKERRKISEYLARLESDVIDSLGEIKEFLINNGEFDLYLELFPDEIEEA